MTYPFWILVCMVAARRLSAGLHCSERCTAAVSAASQAPYPSIPSAEVSRCPSRACSCQENPPSARCHTKYCQGAVAAVKADDCSPPGQQTGRTAALLTALPAACSSVLLLQAALPAACPPVLLLQAALKSTKCSATIQAASSRRLFPSRLFRISCRSFHHSHDRADRFFIHPLLEKSSS